MGDYELVDKVNEHDKVIGRVTRKQAHTEGHIHRSVLFYLFDKHGRIYVNQRTEDKDFYPLYWSIVFGGHVTSGQSYEKAVLKEGREEAGIESIIPFYLASFKKRFDSLDKENVKVYGFILNSEPKVDSLEIRQGSFLRLNELEQKITQLPFLPETKNLHDILKENYAKIKTRL